MIKKTLDNTLTVVVGASIIAFMAWALWTLVLYDYHKYQRKFPNTTFIDWVTE